MSDKSRRTRAGTATPGSRAERSYLTAALRAPENRVALLVLATLVPIVLALSRWPIASSLDADLMRPAALRQTVHVSAVGFAWPGGGGAVSTTASPRLTFNRTLPARFTLEMDVQCTAGCDLDATTDGSSNGLTAQIDVAGTRVPMRIGSKGGRVAVALANPGWARKIRFVLPADSAFRIRNLRLTPTEAPS